MNEILQLARHEIKNSNDYLRQKLELFQIRSLYATGEKFQFCFQRQISGDEFFAWSMSLLQTWRSLLKSLLEFHNNNVSWKTKFKFFVEKSIDSFMRNINICFLNVQSKIKSKRFRLMYNMFQNNKIDVLLTQKFFLNNTLSEFYETRYFLIFIILNCKNESRGEVSIIINIKIIH